MAKKTFLDFEQPIAELESKIDDYDVVLLGPQADHEVMDAHVVAGDRLDRVDLHVQIVVVTVDVHGNTSAASVPLALEAAVRDGRIRRGQKVLLEGVGGGFTWGAVLLEF